MSDDYSVTLTASQWKELIAERDALADERDALKARLAEAERDRDGGWKAFYALRKAAGEDRYPGLTGVVRTDPPIRPADRESESHG